MNKIKDTLYVVVPIYNARRTLKELCNKLGDVLSNFIDYKIILVDDCSCDGSFEIISSVANNDNKIIGIELMENTGQQSAILCGIKYITKNYYDANSFIVTIDDDLEQNPNDIIKLYDKIKEGYECVYGISLSNKKNFRGFGSKLRDLVFNILTNKPKHLKVSSFRIMNFKTAQEVAKSKTKFVYISMEILKHTNNLENVIVKYRKNDNSRYNHNKLIRLLINIVVYYSDLRIFRKVVKSNEAYKIKEIVEQKENL